MQLKQWTKFFKRQAIMVLGLMLLWLPTAGKAEGLEPLVMQLRWITQAQFAGYYVALDKGFYRQRGLEVTILPGGPNLDPAHNLRSGLIDVGIEWLPHALLNRKEGNAIVNIAQIFNRSGYTLSCRKDHGIESLKDLDGKRVGVWFVGDENKVGALLHKENIAVELYPQNFNLDDLTTGRADCVSSMRYNEYLQLLDLGMQEAEITTFDFDQLGVAMLEDGLYVQESKLRDEVMRDRLIRFIAATIEGWRYTLSHPEEALDIVLDNDPTGALEETHQRNMLQVVSGLLHHDPAKIGLLTAEQYQQTLQQMMNADMLRHQPSLGYDNQIWEAASQLVQ